MRGIRAFVFVLLVVLLFFAGCSLFTPVQLVKLNINIKADVSNGILQISKYNVTVKNSSNEIVLSASNSHETSYSISVLPETYTILVEALNSNGKVIGSGSETCSIVAGQSNSLSTTVFVKGSENPSNGGRVHTATSDFINGAESVTVRGEVEFNLVNLVLVPEFFQVKCSDHAGHSVNINSPWNNKVVVNLNNDSTFTCSSITEGFNCTFVKDETLREDRTVVFIIVDKEMESPALLSLTIIHDDMYSDTQKTALWFEAEETVFDSYNEDFSNKGALALSNYIDGISVKVPADTYQCNSSSSNWSDNDTSRQRWSISERSFEVSNGDEKELSVHMYVYPYLAYINVDLSDMVANEEFTSMAQSIRLYCGNTSLGGWGDSKYFNNWRNNSKIGVLESGLGVDLQVRAVITLKDGVSEDEFPYEIVPDINTLTVEEGQTYTVKFTTVEKESNNLESITIMPRYYSYNPETGSSYSGVDTYSREFRRYIVDDDFQLICYPHEIYTAYILGGGTGDESPDDAFNEAFYWYLSTYLDKTKDDIYDMIADNTIDEWLADLSADYPEASSDDVVDCTIITVSPTIPSQYTDSDELVLRNVFFYKANSNFLQLEDGSAVSDEKPYIATEDWGSRQVCWIFLPYSYLEIYESNGGSWNGSHHIFRDYLVYSGVLTAEERDNYNYTFPVSLLKELFVASSSEMRVAMITDYGYIYDLSFNQVTHEGCEAFAEANNLNYAWYKPTADSTEARVAMMETAINAGYNVIVMPGFMFGGPIVEVAPQHKNIKFIALDVTEDDILSEVPGSSYSELGDLLSNVYCMNYKEEIAGFLAGYAAVKMGFTHLGFCGGMAIPSVRRYGYGFVQGADIAANELNVEVDLQYAYANQFFGDADITAAMDDMYLSGTEVVFACGGGVWTSVAEAASKVGGKVIGVDVDQAYTIDGCYGSGTTVTSAIKGFYPSAYSALQDILDGHWADRAGCIANLGLISSTNPDLNYVGIPTGEGTAWNDGFTLEDYKEIIARIMNSDIVVSDDCSSAQPTANTITVNYIGRIK